MTNGAGAIRKSMPVGWQQDARTFLYTGVRLKKIRKPKIRNPVARYMNEFNKPVVIPDKKKREKDGYIKHKEQELDERID